MDEKCQNELFYAAAGKTGLLKYLCHGCRCEIITELPVDLLCRKCDRILLGVDIV